MLVKKAQKDSQALSIMMLIKNECSAVLNDISLNTTNGFDFYTQYLRESKDKHDNLPKK